jgi:hypothetical protein
LQATLRDDVPERVTLLVTVSAPILLPAKTTTVIENRNQIRARAVSGGPNPSGNVLVFVHNLEVDTSALLNTAQSSLNH